MICEGLTMTATLYALSGFACSKEMYGPLKKNVETNELQFHALDNWGMGESKIVGKKNYSLKELAEYHWSLIDEKKLNTNNDLVLLGTSMGGFLVQEMCMQRPDAVSALVFLCTLGPKNNGFTPPVALTEEGLRAFANFPKEQRAFFGTEGTVHPSLKEKHPEIYQNILQYRMNNDSDVNEQVEQNNAAVNFLAGTIDFEKIQSIPTLCLHGENDRFVNPLNAEILKSKFTLSKKVLIPESDHFFFMEKPEMVANEIQEFLTSLKK